jgi:hypothetical protein
VVDSGLMEDTLLAHDHNKRFSDGTARLDAILKYLDTIHLHRNGALEQYAEAVNFAMRHDKASSGLTKQPAELYFDRSRPYQYAGVSLCGFHYSINRGTVEPSITTTITFLQLLQTSTKAHKTNV